MTKALDIAIKKAGGVSELGRRLGESPQVVSNWRRRGVAIKACKRVVSVTRDRRVTMHSLRKTIFPRGTK